MDTLPRRSLAVSLALVLGLHVPGAVSAQSSFDSVQTPRGMCLFWTPIPGGSNGPADSVFNRCVLDRPPRLRTAAPLLPQPWRDVFFSGRLTVVVSPDGSVNRHFTRASSHSGDGAFLDTALAAIGRWRFDPGVRGGVPVRTGFRLAIEVQGPRIDTLPARIEWTYRRGELDADTVVGRWSHDPPLPPFPAEQLDSVHAALLRRLVRMQVVIPSGWRGVGRPRSYCLVLVDGDSAAHARLVRVARTIVAPLAPRGCERSPDALRIVVPRVHRAENGRAVLYAAGDYLPHWPPGLDGEPHRAWRGRCVASVPDRGSVPIQCGVVPIDDPWTGAERRRRAERRAPSGAGGRDRDSLRVELHVTTRDAYWVDTLRWVVPPPVRLAERAVMDTVVPCQSWSIHSPRDSGVVVANGNPSWTLNGADLHMTDAMVEPRSEVAPCVPRQKQPVPWFATLLEGVGSPATVPVTLCLAYCRYRFVVDPERHLLRGPQLRFRLADLREDTRAGNQLVLRMYVDQAPEGLAPIVVVRSGSRVMWASFAWRSREGVWDHGVLRVDGYPPDTEVLVYMVTK